MEPSKFDLKDLDTAAIAEDGFELQLVHPDGQTPLDWFILVRGTDSASYEAETAEQARAWQQKLQRNRKAVLTQEEAQENAYKLLAACTVGWRGIQRDGAPMPFSEAAAVDLYRKYKWIRDQVAEAMQNRANFLARSSTSSSSSPSTSST